MMRKCEACAVMEKHNGWTNYETWCASLWVDNDRSEYEFWREAARSALNQATDRDGLTRREVADLELASNLQVYFEESASAIVPNPGLFSDLLAAAMAEINWHEIATNLIEEVATET